MLCSRLSAYRETRDAKNLAATRLAELEELRAAHRTMSKERDRLQMQLDSINRDITLESAATQGDVSVLTSRCEALQQNLTEARIEANANLAKVEAFDKLHKEFENLQVCFVNITGRWEVIMNCRRTMKQQMAERSSILLK